MSKQQRYISGCGIVLKRTKLKETDMIITILCEDGSLISMVAKGARKPQSVFAHAIELYATIRYSARATSQLAQLTEALPVNFKETNRSDYTKLLTSSIVGDLAQHLAQEDLAFEKFYALTHAALHAIVHTSSQQSWWIAAAYVLKAYSMAGFRPCLTHCCICGSPLQLTRNYQRFSCNEGGCLCSACQSSSYEYTLSYAFLNCYWTLETSTFAQISDAALELSLLKKVFEFESTWLSFHLSISLKSLRLASHDIAALARGRCS